MQGEEVLNKVFISFICLLIISCNEDNNKIIVKRTAQELILEFANDWGNADKYYKRKRIEVSGLNIALDRDGNIVLGEIPRRGKSLIDYIDNHVIIRCIFNDKPPRDLKINEILVIQGYFYEFFDRGDTKSIRLENCVFISRSVWQQELSCIEDNDNNRHFEIDADISLFEVGNDISYLGLDYFNWGGSIFVNNSNYLPYFFVNSETITFTVAFDRDNIVRAVFLGDYPILPSDLFRTPEGVSVGMSYREVLELIPNINLERIVFEGHKTTLPFTLPVFEGYDATLPSGWKIRFMTESFEDKIIMIYKS
jgi:hypothetical protein